MRSIEGTAPLQARPRAGDAARTKDCQLDADGCHLPNDWYLQVSKEISEMLKGKVAPSSRAANITAVTMTLMLQSVLWK